MENLVSIMGGKTWEFIDGETNDRKISSFAEGILLCYTSRQAFKEGRGD
jgi:hypothetical protein